MCNYAAKLELCFKIGIMLQNWNYAAIKVYKKVMLQHWNYAANWNYAAMPPKRNL